MTKKEKAAAKRHKQRWKGFLGYLRTYCGRTFYRFSTRVERNWKLVDCINCLEQKPLKRGMGLNEKERD